jgi:predicted ATPase
MKKTAQKNTLCQCDKVRHKCKRIVVTGGPGGGKTAVLEMVRRVLCPHVVILPEAAGIIFRGGFWRKPEIPARMAAQRAIFHVQRELEQLVEDEESAAIALCDRGSLDSLAYWPGTATSFFKQLQSSQEQEIARYAAVIHLRTPSALTGYDQSNPLRMESASEAQAIDLKIEAVWRKHPRRYFVENSKDFLEKAKAAIELIKNELPSCCKSQHKSHKRSK